MARGGCQLCGLCGELNCLFEVHPPSVHSAMRGVRPSRSSEPSYGLTLQRSFCERLAKVSGLTFTPFQVY